MKKQYQFKPFELTEAEAITQMSKNGSMRMVISRLEKWISEPFIADESKLARVAFAKSLLADMMADPDRKQAQQGVCKPDGELRA